MIERTETVRLFVAVPLPDTLKAEIGAAMSGLKQRLSFRKWVHPDDLHITLKFIGEAPPSAIGAIETALERVAARSTPFPLALAGIGTFGAGPAPRVLWLGLGGRLEPLKALQSDVERQLASLGYEPEGRPYAPHITLARQYGGSAPMPREALKDAAGLGPEADADTPPRQWTVDRIALYRSHFGRSPMYEPIRTVAFYAGG